LERGIEREIINTGSNLTGIPTNLGQTGLGTGIGQTLETNLIQDTRGTGLGSGIAQNTLGTGLGQTLESNLAQGTLGTGVGTNYEQGVTGSLHNLGTKVENKLHNIIPTHHGTGLEQDKVRSSELPNVIHGGLPTTGTNLGGVYNTGYQGGISEPQYQQYQTGYAQGDLTTGINPNLMQGTIVSNIPTTTTTGIIDQPLGVGTGITTECTGHHLADKKTHHHKKDLKAEKHPHEQSIYDNTKKGVGKSYDPNFLPGATHK